MTPNNFDELSKKLAIQTSRRGMLRILAVGAAGAAAAAVGLGRSGVQADHTCLGGDAGTKTLGEACGDGGGGKNCCDPTGNLVCVNVGSTGAHRCECAEGFQDCGDGTCRATCGPQSCPEGSEACTPTGSTTQLCLAPCPTGQQRLADCTCGCPAGQVFCNNACFNPSSACDCHNKVFNATCCSCENPGQPSGKCKGALCTASGCTCENARRTDTF
jgi:hypothetical protein